MPIYSMKTDAQIWSRDLLYNLVQRCIYATTYLLHYKPIYFLLKFFIHILGHGLCRVNTTVSFLVTLLVHAFQTNNKNTA